MGADNNPLISVIIPVYNVEKYLDYCIKSVMAQDYRYLDIILVDDGSTDLSGKICDDYAARDKRITVIHKKNGGLSSARNVGIALIKGKYLCFIDSDDYIRSDYISKLLSYITADNTDLVCCSYKKVIGDIDYMAKPQKKTEHLIFDKKIFVYQMVSRKIPMYAHGKLYDAKLVPYLVFPEGRVFEDVITNWQVINKIQKATFFTEQLYFYRQREESITNAEFNPSRMDQLYFSEQIFSEVNHNSDLGYAAGTRCFFSAADNYALAKKKNVNEKKYLEQAIIKYRSFVLKDSCAEINLKIMALLSFINIGFVRIMGLAYKRYKYIITKLERLRYENSSNDSRTVKIICWWC